jgi:hypothetical protein
MLRLCDRRWGFPSLALSIHWIARPARIDAAFDTPICRCSCGGPDRQESQSEDPMADQTGSRYQTMDSSDRPVGGWTEELIVFAGVMMIMSGIFQCFAGVVAIFDNAVYVTTLGWIQLLLGVVVALAGAALGSGRTWGRPVAVILAALSALTYFLLIPSYPFWALTVITFHSFVMWALRAEIRSGGILADRVEPVEPV